MKNLRQTRSGWQKYTRVAGRFVSEHTEERPSPNAVRQWVHLKQSKPVASTTDDEEDALTMDVAVPDYLGSVASMPSYADRQLHMTEWKAHFRGRIVNSIKAIEISTRLHALRKTYAASSCNKRRTALMSFFTSMNGRSGYNPVRDVPKFHEEEEPRALTMWTAYRILALMRPSKTRARLRVILWTGWPHAQLQRLKPAHLDLVHNRAFVTPRRKGKGRKGTWLELLPGAVIALRDFVQWDCFTPTVERNGKKVEVPFSPSAMHSSFARALKAYNARRARFVHPPIDAHPYDLRHTFGTFVATHVTDERAIQELMMHSRAEQTRRYTEAATAARVAAAVATFRSQKKSA